MLELLARFWCRRCHTRTFWPIHGRYRCLECRREYPAFPKEGK